MEGSADVFCVLSEAAEINVNPGFRQNSSVLEKELEKACSGQERAFPSTRAPKKSGGDGGFTCCVPGCFSNKKKNPELPFYNFPNGKSPESQELRKKWIHLISRKNFTPMFMQADQVINKLLMTVVYWICLRREILSWLTRDLK